MFGVKLTVVLIVITVIIRYMTNNGIKNEDLTTKVDIVFGNKYPWYAYVAGILTILSFIGIVYSVIYMLFLR